MAGSGSETKGGEKPPEETKPEVKGATPEEVTALRAQVAELERHKEALNKENAERRLENKRHKEQLDTVMPVIESLKKVFGGAAEPAPAGGEKPTANELLKQQATQFEAKQKRSLIRAAFSAEVAKDAHDPDTVWMLGRDALKDVAVDLDAETVDKAAVKEKVDGMRKAHPYLFQPPGDKTTQTGTVSTTTKATMPGATGGTASGGNKYTEWRALVDASDRTAAAEFYQKNRAAIVATMPKQGR